MKQFYDNFVQHQKKVGINKRIYGLYKRLLKLGLNRKSRVLELGCGIGSLSYLITKKAKLEAVDFSPGSIKEAEKNNGSFFVGDITNYIPYYKDFDFILLFDVIEHIPNLKGLFKNLSKIATDKTKILINIPNPNYLSWLKRNKPEILQPIDNPIYLDELCNILIYSTKFEIIYFERYSIFVENDYDFIILQKRRQFTEQKVKRNIIKRMINYICIFVKWD